MNEIVFRGANDQALTNSLLVAKEFGKEHSKVMRDINNLACSQEFRAANFGESSYTSEQGKEFPMCTMTKDGFSFLVMGYTGKKAAQFKEAYIKAFNKMEEEIRSSVKPKSQLEILQLSINQLIEQEHRLTNVEQRLDNFEKERVENGKQLLKAEPPKMRCQRFLCATKSANLLISMPSQQTRTNETYGIRFMTIFIMPIILASTPIKRKEEINLT